jgi:hypothetical protein
MGRLTAGFDGIHPVEMAGADRVDPITAEVIRGALETVAFVMATHCRSPRPRRFSNQSNERNATILDARGRLAALSVGIRAFMLSSTLPVRFAIEFFARRAVCARATCSSPTIPIMAAATCPTTTSSLRSSSTGK